MRPKLGAGKSEVVAIRIPVEWGEKLRGMVDEKNPLSELLRDAIRRYLRIGDG